MKKIFPAELNEFRLRQGPLASDDSFGFNGFFIYDKHPYQLKIMCGVGEGWDHVSVSTQHRTPTWEEMCLVKDLFFDPEETVIQYHPPKSQYVNCCGECLHMWRQWDTEITTPPMYMVGPKCKD